MPPTALLISILLISTIAAILAGVAVFTNIVPEPQPPDPRIEKVMEALADIRLQEEEIQKALYLLERKLEKDTKALEKELIEHVNKSVVEILLKAIQDQGGEGS